MCYKLRIVLFLIFVYGSQSHNVSSNRDLKNAVYDNEFDGKSSLVFVFDTTGSMYNDLKQLREGAELILNTALEESDVIGDFVFVPFHDPVVGPATVTRDKKVFHSALDIIRVYGGGDCPEKSLSGIQLALDVSRPKSFMYVFTDATAADHRLVGKVLDAVQRKQTQVVFVLTGHCNDLNRPSYKVYQQIAAASSGQVFNLNKTSVHKVLDFVRSSIKGRSVNLGSVVQPGGQNYTQGIPVDSSLSEVTVSVSGANPQIRVVNPSGEEITGPPQLVTTLDLSEIMVVKVLDPEPGNWTVTVGSEQGYSVKVVGMSNLTFSHGFSVAPPSSAEEISYRPLKGTYNHMLISLSPTDAAVNVNYAQIVALEGRILFEVPLKRFKEEMGVYIAEAFVPPDDFFYIAIEGKDEHNQELRRIGATAVQAKVPDIPFITAPRTVAARSHERVVLKCSVESLVPVTAMWTRDMVKVQPQISSLQSTSIEYVIENMSEEHVGMYRCIAKNVAGVGKADTELSLAVEPPLVTIAPQNTTVLRGVNVTVSCAVYTEAFLKKFQLVHNKTGSPSKVYNVMAEPNIDGVYSFNKTIASIEEIDAGTYSCVAANRGGETINSTNITVKSHPASQILGPHTITKLTHTILQIVCTVDNADKLQWIAPNGSLVAEVDVNGSYTGAMDVVVEEDGVWKCIALKGELKSTDALELKTVIKPTANIMGDRNITIISGDSVNLTCVVVAKPAPRIIWHRETEVFLNHTVELTSSDTYKSTLHLNSSLEVVDGMYFCFGENSQGIGHDNATVRMTREMVVLRRFEDLLLPAYSEAILHCDIDSYPPPKIAWYKNNKTVITDENVKISKDNSTLTVRRVNFNDEAIYSCEASNDYEVMRIDGTLRILVCPEISKGPDTITVMKGEAAVITCRILQGHPEPSIIWQYKKRSFEDFGKLPSNAISNHTILNVYNASDDSDGSYRCVAENTCGKDEFSTTLMVQSPPELVSLPNEELIKPIEAGDRVTFSCKAEGTPRPAVVWNKDGRPVSYSTRVFIDNTLYRTQSIEQLVIEGANVQDSGIYTCNAASSLGSVAKEFPLVVYESPVIDSNLSDQVSVNEGQYVELPCVARGHPKPDIRWLHDGQPATDTRRSFDETGIRFIANLTDFGTYTCIAENEFASTSLNFSVFVWVPPSIEPPLEDKQDVFVGQNITLQCDVVGFPIPNIMWEFNDVILSENTTDLRFNKVGDIFIINASLRHEGVYVCIAENIAGMMTKSLWLNVNEPLRISPDNFEGPYIATNMDTSLVISCNVTGKPKPFIVWSKDDYYLNNDPRFEVDSEGTLTIKSPTEDLSGAYTCTAKSVSGQVNRTVSVEIYSLPTQMQSDQTHTAVTVVEGRPAHIACPISASKKDHIKWYKDAKIVSRGQLEFSNVSRHDAGTYACVVTNAVSSSSASVLLRVEWPPGFVDNTGGGVEAVKGGDYYFDCEVDSKPVAKTKWLFNSRPMLFQEQPRLKLLTVQIWHTGVYQCVVSNTHGAVTKRFSLDVLEPPFISEFDLLDVRLKEGVNATLQCDARGTPIPSVEWSFNNTNWHVINSTLSTTIITASSSGLYRCDATNKAGRAHLVYRVSVVSPAKVLELVTYENGVGTTVGDKVEAVLGSRLRISCSASGLPPPRIQWIRNGNTLMSREEDLSLELVMENLQTNQAGSYSCVVSNDGGIHERRVKLEILEPPKIFQTLFENSNYTDNVVNLEVMSGQAFYLHCHPYGNPLPEVYWFKNDLPLRLFDDSMVSTDYGEVIVSKNAVYDQTGNYTCVARNKVGNNSVSYLVDVLVPPPTPKETTKAVPVKVGKPLQLNCPVEGSPLPYVMWVKHPYTELGNTSRVLLFNNYTLFINKTEVSDSGTYSCILTNKVGTTEIIFEVTVEKAPKIGHMDKQTDKQPETHVVALRRSLVLKCEVDGHPLPKITWLKDTQQLSNSLSNVQRVLGNSLLAIWSASVRDAGQYICVAENTAGTAHRRYNVVIQVPGKWSKWSQWDYCNATCGLGHQHRSRVCRFVDDDDNPIDKTTQPDKILVDESACKGLGTDRRKCHMPPCETEDSAPSWSAWSRWSACSATCGAAAQARHRRCRRRACRGDNVQIRKCPGLPKCGDFNSSENDVYNNIEDTIPSDPYVPEATFEVQPEVVGVPSYNDVEEFRDNSFIYSEREYSNPRPLYYDVNVTENLDHSERGPCDPGYVYNSTANSCDDIDECPLETNRCHSTQTCVNTAGGYRCGCPAGYHALSAGSRCLDINECIQDIHGCEFACVNVAGGYVCACPRHLRLHVDKHHCVEPSLYREPLNWDHFETDDYLSTSVDAPIKYTRVPVD
ncbi:hemicentin-1-like [Amyelois transitella]|uniref:hemicentin-1-like n=1 Tax=Amyelois transitella TaxID=680683 RepID=UPI00298FE27D|nr:hemicentin-1-like [Amyelois transitella]